MSARIQEPLLATKHLDEDNISMHSDISDSELEDDVRKPRPTDREVLDESEQQESLLSKYGRAGLSHSMLDGNKKERTRRRIQRRGRQMRDLARGSGNAELMYEMEGGYKDNSSRSSSQSVELKQERWNTSNSRPYGRIFVIVCAIVSLFVLLGIGALKASRRTDMKQIFSNGTHTFGATTILISLDGFRADFLQRDLTPAMNAFIASGVSPKYMLPSFPSLTFPNHYTLVTGMYPESHGIVGNQFWDPVFEEEFYYTNITSSMQPKWWANAEPIWNTAEKQGLKTAIHMWPGSEAHISNMNPTYLDKFNESELLDVKVNRILGWLDMPRDERPQFIGAYVPNVDADGHLYGPNSTEIRETIVEVDNMLTLLVEGLYERNLTEIINLVIVSDHGMATTSNDRLVQLDDYIDMSLVDHIDGWPLRGLRLRNPDRDVPMMYRQLLKASTDGSFDVYTLDTMPERYHFSRNDRIAPLWVVPKAGWAVVERPDFDVEEAKAAGLRYSPMGLHGYDHEHPLMRAIFIARGPAFPHPANSRVPAFQNIEVYNIVCDSLGLKPHANNGTLRLPFKTEGVHSDYQDQTETPVDPVEEAVEKIEAPTVDATSATSATSVLSTTTTTAISASIPSASDSPKEDEAVSQNDGSKAKWWDFIHEQIEKAKEWAKQFADSFKNNKPNADGDEPQ